MNYNEDYDKEADWINSQELLNDIYSAGLISREQKYEFLCHTLWAGSALGLSMSHIFAPRGKLKTASITAWRGAGLLQCVGSRLEGRKNSGGGTRGKITGFSKQSRLRLMRLVSAIRRDEMPIFITLTYPGEYSDNPREWKRNLKNFMTRLGRLFGDDQLAVLWKLEPQKRGAPHFHLLLWGLPQKTKTVGWLRFHSWVSQSWYEVVGSGDERHLRAGTRVEKIRSRNGVMFYASKYLSKIEEDHWGDLDVGRFWGVYFRDNLPLGDAVTVSLTPGEAKRILRIMRKRMRLSGRSVVSLSMFYGADFWYSRLPDILYPEFMPKGGK